MIYRLLNRGILVSILFIGALSLLFIKCEYYNAEDLFPMGPCDTTKVSYSTNVDSIFKANCYQCHSTSVASGGVILDNYSDAIIPAQAGLMLPAVSHQPGFPYWMPLNLPQLPRCDLAIIRIWINNKEPQKK